MMAFCVVAKLRGNDEQTLASSLDPGEAQDLAAIARKEFKDDPDVDEIVVEHKRT